MKRVAATTVERIKVVAVASILGLIGSLAGCSPMVWVKAGGTQDEFAQDNYTCLQESQQRQGRAQVNQFGGSAIDTVTTNRGLFGACMNAHGWYLGQQDDSDKSTGSVSRWTEPGWIPPAGIGTSNAVDVSRTAEIERRKAAERALSELTIARMRLTYICYDITIYAPLWKKGACKPEAITPDQLADRSKADAREVRLMQLYVDELKGAAALVILSDRASGNLSSALAAEAARDAVVVPATGLMDGSMTWGAYNKARFDLLGASRSPK